VDSTLNESALIIDTIKTVRNLIKLDSSEMLELIKGDLNADGRGDIFAIASRNCRENEAVSQYSKCNRAYLIIAEEDGRFRIEKYNDDIIACSDCEQGRPYVTIDIGIITIERTLGACTRDFIKEVYHFDKTENIWILKESQKSTVNCNDDPVNGEIPIKTFPVKTQKDFGKIIF